MDTRDLKIQALLEKIADLTTRYENQAADYRVEITLLKNTIEQVQQENEELRKSDAQVEEAQPEPSE